MHNYSADLDDSNAITIVGKDGRDAGKSFRINEVPVRLMAGFVLRLLSALNLEGRQDDLLALVPTRDPAEGEDAQEDAEPSGAVLRVLGGCKPEALTELLNDALEYVQIAPDVKHPGAFRALQDNDIREMATLVAVLIAFVRVNLTSG